MLLSDKHKQSFLSKIAKTSSCWNWLPATQEGYGRFGVKVAKNRTDVFYAHRVSYELHVGLIPKNKLVLHQCNNRRCVNPGHLFLGTHQENTNYMMRKGRYSRRVAKLTPEKVLEIRKKRNDTTIVSLAKEYDVSRTTIINICLGRSWKFILGGEL